MAWVALGRRGEGVGWWWGGWEDLRLGFLQLVQLPWLGTWYLPRSGSRPEAGKEKEIVGVAAALPGTGAKLQ